MKSILKNTIKFLFIFLLTLCSCSCSLGEYIKNAVLSNIPIVKNFVQKEFKTYTSITGIKDEMKLVTAKQQLDFITIMDGKDGRYLEISTYEVKAGIDCSKIKYSYDKDGNTFTDYPSIEILECSKIHSVAPRLAAERNNADFYDACIKPVNKAYDQKARDYSVELGLLENAKKGVEETFKKMLDLEVDLDINNYKATIPLPYLPLHMEIANTYLNDKKIEIAKLPDNQFNRDSLVLKTTTNDNWEIRFGDSGRTYFESFDSFYNNVFTTNTDEGNQGKDRVEIFRYFDPMYPKESEILSYASDNYRTFFILNNGRIYYVDAVYKNQQTMIDTISPSIIYFATSIRKTEEKVPNEEAYSTYISNYFDVQENIRTNASRLELMNSTEKLIKSNILRPQGNDYSEDEKYLLATADIKLLGRTSDQIEVHQTGDREFDNLTYLIKQLLVSHDEFSSDESREMALRVAAELDTKIYHKQNVKDANSQYLLTWFLQNQNLFGLSPEKITQYTKYLEDGECYIASRPAIVSMGDSQRNEYFYNLFRNRLSMADYFVDTAGKIDDDLWKSKRGNNLFAYYKLPQFKELVDGEVNAEIEKQMKNINKDKYQINNSFILVFSQTEWDWGFAKDEDIHALVFDDSTLRIFPNIGSQNLLEKIGHAIKEKVGSSIKDNPVTNYALATLSPTTSLAIKSIFNSNNTPRFFYYGDWKNLRVNPYTVTIGGQSFGTKKITKKGKADYRNTNDYAEKSMIASFIDDLQHAFSDDDPDYYHRVLCENLEYHTQRYVYDIIWRPSPRMILDTRPDQKRRYNN